jgi:hypothetical protein
MIWEDEPDPLPQAMPNQQESNSIDEEITGKRPTDFPMEQTLQFGVAPVVSSRMNVTLSFEEIGKSIQFGLDALLRQVAWQV